MQSKADPSETQDGDCGDVLKQHRGDQPSRGVAMGVTSRQPTGDTQRKQPCPADASHGQGGGSLQWRTDQEHHRCRGETQQGQTGSQFNHCGCSVQSFHGRGTLELLVRKGLDDLIWLVMGMGQQFRRLLLVIRRHL
jgi:hypothetical protein